MAVQAEHLAVVCRRSNPAHNGRLAESCSIPSQFSSCSFPNPSAMCFPSACSCHIETQFSHMKSLDSLSLAVVHLRSLLCLLER